MSNITFSEWKHEVAAQVDDLRAKYANDNEPWEMDQVIMDISVVLASALSLAHMDDDVQALKYRAIAIKFLQDWEPIQ